MPVLGEGRTVTAGNASQLSDGAAALVVMEAGEAARRGLDPLGALRGFAVAGVALDGAVQVADGLAPTLDGLQEHAVAVHQDAGDALVVVVLAGALENAFDGRRRGIDGAAGIEQANEHVRSPGRDTRPHTMSPQAPRQRTPWPGL